MIRRPKATDTEEDLLAFQERFLSSGEKPSVSVKVKSESKVKVGSKREQQALLEDSAEPPARDVVNMQVEGRPSAKRSKFKEQRMKEKGLQDHHKALESQDMHSTDILSEIYERRDARDYTMPTLRYTKGGFPSVQALGSATVPSAASETTKPVKKSLFAQEFEAHGPGHFGVEISGEGIPSSTSEGKPPASEGEPLAQAEEHMEQGDAVPSQKERLNAPSLISGDGLVSVGVSAKVAKEEVMKIHEENVQRLSALSEEEILKEMERIKQQLDPHLLNFIKTRHLQKQSKPSESEPMTTDQVSKDIPPPDLPVSASVTTPTSWVHMDIIEKEKMEWMTDVDVHPPSKGDNPGNEDTNEMRFSLEGLVIPRSVVLPAHLGLHHHGDEPQAAGYTITELVALCRSTVLQQRTFSLQLLAKVIQRARLNEYAEITSDSQNSESKNSGDSVLEDLLSRDIPLLLRYALDESVGAVMFAAAAALHSLLVIPVENMVMDEFILCHRGCVLPALRSPDRSRNQQSKEERDSETDEEVLRRDIVLGYLKMKLLHRVRYILEVCAPPTPLPSHLLDVVTRVTRHSLFAATEVYNCPRLMDVLFTQYLPLDWSGVVDGKACVSAMKVVHALCSASKTVTTGLLSQYKLSSVLVRYGVPSPSELGLPQELAYTLSTISLLAWSVAVGYGLASEPFRDTYSELLKQLHSVSMAITSPVESRRTRALLCLVEAAVHVATISPEQLRIKGTNDTHPSPAINWGHANGLLLPLVNHLEHLHDPSCAGNVLHCLASFYSVTHPKFSPVDQLEGVAALLDGSLSLFCESPLFNESLQVLLTSSSGLALPNLKSTSSPPSLPSHLTPSTTHKPALYGRPTMQTADYHDLVQHHVSSVAAAHFVWGYVRLLRVSLQVNKSIVKKVGSLVKNQLYWDYLRKVAHSEVSKVSTFNLVEVYLLLDVVMLFKSIMELNEEVPVGCGQLSFDLSLKLLKLLPPGLESAVWELLTAVVMHPSLIGSANPPVFLETDVTSLSLRDKPQPVTLEGGSTMTNSQLLLDALENMASIQSTYQITLKQGGLCSQTKLNKSESVLGGQPLKATSKLLPPGYAPILPEDWVLLPVVQEYNTPTAGQRLAKVEDSSPIATVTHALQLLSLLEHFHPHVLKGLPISAKLCRLMCVFLIDSELFLNKTVHSLLSSLLSLYCRDATKLDFRVSSFVDLYLSLLEQFSAVSYGDHLFSCYLLLPLQQRLPSHFRKMVWGEHPGIIRVFSLPLSEVPVALENFLVPAETDMQLIDMYMAGLSAQTVRPLWSPVFYLIAVHHVHNFIFGESGSVEKKKQLLSILDKLSNQEIKRDVLLYDGVDLGSPRGLKIKRQPQ